MNTPFVSKLLLWDKATINIEVCNGSIHLVVCAEDVPDDRVEIELRREELKDIAKLFQYAWENSAALVRKKTKTPLTAEGSSLGIIPDED